MADGVGHRPRGPGGVFRAALWSLNGLKGLHESSFRLEVCMAAVMAPLGILLGATAVERVLLVGVLALVLAAELLNSAIEAVIERFGNEWHDLAGRAKDMGSAAVFVLTLNVVLTWGLILVPRVMPHAA